MARVPQVTRTIATTNVTLMMVDTTAGEVYNKDVILPRTYEDDKAVLKAAKKLYDSEEHKVVQVVRTSVAETLYGMSEADFIAHAKVLPPRSGTADQPEDMTAEG